MTELWVERTSTRRYTGRSTRGAQVLVGSEDVEGVFTPGELMKIALAACSGMSTDAPLARRLGDDYTTTIRVSGPPDREQERYPLLEEKMQVDLSTLSDDDRARLLVVVNRAVDQVCTVARTLKSGTTVTFEVSPDEPLARRASEPDEPLARRASEPDEPLARRASEPDEPLARRASEPDEPLARRAPGDVGA